MKKRQNEPNQAKPPSGEDNDTLVSLAETLRAMIADLQDAVADAKRKDPALVKQLVSLVTELRKVDAARRKRLEALTLPMVIAFLRNLEPEERARVGRELQQMDARGGVLG